MIDKIISEIYQNKHYENLCKSLVKSDWQGFWHDVILRLYEKEELIVKAKEAGYLEQYVITCIYNFFKNKIRADKQNVVHTSQLFNFCNNSGDEEQYSWWESKEFEFFKRSESDERAVEVTKEAVNEVTKMMMNGDSGAMILWQASQSNVYTVSRRLGTSSYQVNKTIKPIIKQIKRKLK